MSSSRERNKRPRPCLPEAAASAPATVKARTPHLQGQTSQVNPSHQDTEKIIARLRVLARRLERTPPKITLKAGKAKPYADQLLLRAGLTEALGTADPDLVLYFLVQIDGVALFGVTREQKLNIALAALHGINPRDELEGLLAVQMVGTHNLAMEFLRRAVLKGQTVGGIDANTNRATKLLQTFAAQTEALSQYRGKSEQKVVV
jgi:hypothetical protein